MASFSLEAYLAAQKRRVEMLFANRLEEIGRSAPPTLVDAMRYSVMGGGKRIRPILCLTFAGAESQRTGATGAVAEDAAVAVEFIHTYSLIHDDLPAMDNDDLRRGQPTSHRKFGEALAILAGDALLTDAFAVAANGDEPERREIVRLLADASGPTGMVAGQVLDIDPKRPADETFLARVHRLKTGSLIQAACAVGAICGGSREVREVALTYGAALGLAFQITDDILDVTGRPEELGKKVGADAKAGRRTFPAVVGIERAKELARLQAQVAIDVARRVEPDPGPLAALAAFSIERRS